MGRASREKRERNAALEAVAAIKASQPWYESNLLWASLSTSIALVLAVVAAAMKDLRFLLWLAVCFGIHPCWVVSANIGIKRTMVRKIVFFLVVGILFFGAYTGYSFLKESPLAITPVRIPLAHAIYPDMNLHGQYDFVVYNRGDDPHYQIWIKLLLNSEVVSPEMLDLDFPTLEERERAGMSINEMAAGTMCMPGKDNIRRPSFLCLIDVLNPRETFKIKLTAMQSFDNASRNNMGEITASLLRSYGKPSMHYSAQIGKRTGTAAEYNYPEAFHRTAMIHYCSKTRSETRPDVLSDMPVTCTKNSKSNIERAK